MNLSFKEMIAAGSFEAVVTLLALGFLGMFIGWCIRDFQEWSKRKGK
jgi:hypothetical protein